MGILFAALRNRFPLLLHPAPGLLNKLPALSGYLLLSFGFIFQSQINCLEAIHILDFNLSQRIRAVLGTNTDIGIAPEASLFHISGGYTQIPKYAAQSSQVFLGFFWGVQVRLTDNLHQRHSRAVDIHQAIGLSTWRGMMDQFGYIFLKVNTGYTYLLLFTINFNSEPAPMTKGVIIL